MQPEEGGGSAAQDGFSAGNADDLARFADSIRRFGADAGSYLLKVGKWIKESF